MTSVVPSPHFRRLVHARRNNPLAPPKRLDAAKDFAAAQKSWLGFRKHWLAGWERRGNQPRAQLEQAGDRVLQTGQLPEALDVDCLAAAERMLNGSATILGYVARRYGPTATLRVKLRALDFQVASGREKEVWWWTLVDAPANSVRVTDIGWEMLRNVFCAASQDDYAEARELAAQERTRWPEPKMRVMLAYAFPGEEPWSRDDMTAALAAPDFAKTTYLIAPLMASLTDGGLAEQFVTKCEPRQSMAAIRFACDIVAGMPAEAAAKVLLAMTERTLAARHFDPSQLRQLASALTAIVGAPMADALARYVGHPRFGRYVITYFEEHTELARGALASRARGKSTLSDEVRLLLASSGRVGRDDTGSMDDAPDLLRAPPWERKRSQTVLQLGRAPYDETIAWAEGEQERMAASPAVVHPNAVVRPIEPAELVEFDALPEVQKYVDVWPRWNNKQWTILELPEDRRLALWDGGKQRLYARPPCFMLAVHGQRALDGLFARDPFDANDERLITACLRVDSPRAALVCARLLARRKTERPRARAWLHAHAAASATGLVPAAFGKEGRSRRMAERALRYLAHVDPEVVRRTAEGYGPEVSAAVVATFFRDPLARLDPRGAPPQWLRVERLPALSCRGRPLPRRATKVVLDVLRARGEDVPYLGVDVLRESLDAPSLAELAWTLFVLWSLHGRRRLHEWMAMALAPFGGEGTVARLSRYSREWAHADPRACVTIVEVLGAIGSDEARVELLAIGERARSPMLVQAVSDALRALGTEEVPEGMGLDERGETTLDLGSRTLRVVLDEQLVPYVVLEDGRRVPQVPRPRKNDDPHLAARATARFNRLRREAKVVASTTLRRLEQGMIDRRRYVLGEIGRRVLHHPLLGPAARRLVWEVVDAPATTFRVGEDGRFSDAQDLPILLEPDTVVRVAHPLFLSETTLSAWGTLFADYEVVQPFEQLGRFVFRGSPAEAADILKTTAGTMIEPRALLKIADTHGWSRPAGARIASFWRDVKHGANPARLFVSFTPGIQLHQVRKGPLQKLNAMSFPPRLAPEGFDAVTISELVRMALALRG